ncbi:MAG: hypothetical protein U1A27_06020 [Phycisphaerae bacterium]
MRRAYAAQCEYLAAPVRRRAWLAGQERSDEYVDGERRLGELRPAIDRTQRDAARAGRAAIEQIAESEARVEGRGELDRRLPGRGPVRCTGRWRS